MEMVVTTRADKMCKAPGKSYVLQYTRRYSYLLIFLWKGQGRVWWPGNDQDESM